MPRTLPWALVSILLLCIMFSNALAQSSAPANSDPGIGFHTLYNFTGGDDGCCIYGGLAADRTGTVYGVAYSGRDLSDYGDLYKLTHRGHGYSFEVLQGLAVAGGGCITTPTIDRAGNVFGVCDGAGGAGGYGTLWEYSHEGKFSILHAFGGPTDGSEPQDSVILDASGNIYGTTYTWGPGGSGTLWEYSASGVFTLLHAFADGDDGGLLPAGPAIDATGKIWGTTETGPNCYYCGSGTAWSYDPASGTFTTVQDFSVSEIVSPQSRLAVDAAGNLYGTGFTAVRNNCGLVYELQASNNYAPVVLYAFNGDGNGGCEPFGRVVLDVQGNIFGTTYDGGANGNGAVYELTPGIGWQETILHSFDITDGSGPQSGLITDGANDWFGTTSSGGSGKWGTVFEISNVH
jgi:uncharacterized repeat protein (TIGR03803 family)